MRMSDAKRPWSRATVWLCYGGLAGGALLIAVYLLAFTGLGGCVFSTTAAAVLSPTGRFAWANWCIPDDAEGIIYGNLDRFRASAACRLLRNTTGRERDLLEVMGVSNSSLASELGRRIRGVAAIARHREAIGGNPDHAAPWFSEFLEAGGAHLEYAVLRVREDLPLEHAAGVVLRAVQVLRTGTEFNGGFYPPSLEAGKIKTLGDTEYIEFGTRGIVAKIGPRIYYVSPHEEHLAAALRRRERKEVAVVSEGLREALESARAEHFFVAVALRHDQHGDPSSKPVLSSRRELAGLSIATGSHVRVRGVFGYSDAAAAWQKEHDEHVRGLENRLSQMLRQADPESRGPVESLSKTLHALHFEQTVASVRFEGDWRVADLKELLDALRPYRSAHPFP